MPEPQEDLLGDVFCLSLIVEDTSRETEDRTTVASIDLSESDFVVARDERDELRVARFAEVTHTSPIRRRRDIGCRDWCSDSSGLRFLPHDGGKVRHPRSLRR